MTTKTPDPDSEIERLKARLEELEEVLFAIRSGEVDAIVGPPETGGKIYTLKGAETPYRHFLETITEGAVTLSPEGMILYANRGFAGIIHMPPEQIIGSSFSDLVVDSDREEYAAMLSSAFKKPIIGELSIERLSGADAEPVPVQLSFTKLPGDDTNAIGGVITDLTSRKQREEIIRSEQLALSIFKQAGEAIVVCNTDGIIIRANAVARQLAGTYPIHQPFTTVFPVVFAEDMTVGSMIQALLSGTTFQGSEVHLKRSDSVEIDLLFSGSPLTGDANETIGFVIVLSNITEQKKSKEHILYLNTLLITIRNINQLLVHERNPDILLQEVCDIISEGSGFENAWIVHFDENGVVLRAYESGLGTSFVELETLLQQGNLPWCLRDAVQQEGVRAIESPEEECLTCPLLKICDGRTILTCSLTYEGEDYGILSARLPENLTLNQKDQNLFKEICDDVGFGMHIVILEQNEKSALVQIQQNLMQLAAMNDEIRNPLTVIRMLNERESTEKNRKIIDDQVVLIDENIRRLDRGWMNSKKIWHHLNAHYGIQSPDNKKTGKMKQ